VRERVSERERERQMVLGGSKARTVTTRLIHYVTIAVVFSFCTHAPPHARARASQALDTCCVAESSRTRVQCAEGKSRGERTEGGGTFPQVDICVLRSDDTDPAFLRENERERESKRASKGEKSLGGTTRLLHCLTMR
jgi:hypothetical protein